MRGIENCVGPTISTIPIAVGIDWAETIEAFLARRQSEMMETVPHEQFGLQNIYRALGGDLDPRHIQTLLVVQPVAEGRWALDKDGLLFKARSFSSNVDTLGVDPFNNYPLQVTASDEDLEVFWAQNSVLPRGSDVLVHDSVALAATAQPDSVAMDAWDGRFTYRKLDELSTQIVHRLAGMDIVEGSVVAIYSEKSKWVPLVQVAVYKAGGVTVLQSVAVPELRMAKVFKNIGVKLAVVSESRLEVVSSHARCCTVDQLLQTSLHNHNKNLPKALPLLNITSPAAILVSSGSTGEPKQVLWSHGTLSSNAKAHGEYLGVYPGTRVFQFASYDFDVSTIESISTLVHAGCLCIPSESDRRNDITGAFNRMDCDYSYFTPSVAKSLDPAALPGLRTLTMGGEPIQSVEVARWTQAKTIIGIYGPAECAQALTFALLSPTTRNNHVGRPYGANVWLVEPGRPDCLAGVGTTAELAIEGPTLSRGYFGDPPRSAAAYVESPSWLSRGAEGHAPRRAMIYITGDLARYGADGSLDFIGRKDALVKLRG
ncbi:putative NRPS-like protein biosynthetic cluster [Pyricularia oryzae]|nr:putative NRPS-like protein biosynthetic cluster [Pyricularia oryzae]KAI6253841.1 putative NRPS-like protein biosynthetic cluster [Pyricularia oryzae]KAI6269049.1 putative NRPS-like protein biosynthetic cluster [Pyricularia oryzae]KAI6396870.1 putative NRPS-like protein biosynthetic cluster [Pyricularia oryzae]KAI6397554.1 putative NRPS-like protein biosynthetic cluster [Pyricularia oryzae]